MSNVNCLKGIRCPSCGSDGPFDINVYAVARVFDDGIDEITGAEWRDNDVCSCPVCGRNGTVDEFKSTGDKS